MDRLDLDERARKTLEEMMVDWGAGDCEVHDRHVALFKGPGRSATVVIADPKLKEVEVGELLEIESDNHEGIHRSVVIAKDPKKRYPKVGATVFHEAELFFNRSRHPDAQNYALLSEEEAGDLCAAFGITLEELPKMYVTDPQARYRGYAVGDVVRISRKTANGLMTHYRRVIGAP